MRQVWLAAVSVALLGGCSTVIEGPTQDISIDTAPSGATCTLIREGAPLAVITSTPATVTIQKNQYDIEIVCDLDGYERTTFLDQSGTAAAVFGNILIGGARGVEADRANGSSYKYDSPVAIVLSPRTNKPLSDSLTVAASAPASPPPRQSPVPPSPPPAAAVASASLPTPVANPVSAGPVMSVAAVPVDPRRAENAAERYRVLGKLVSEGLIPQDRYGAWAQQNVGAFLLTTAQPPSAAVGNKPPNYGQLADFLRSVAAEKNRAVAEAERQAMFGRLMPMDGARAQPMKPPADADGLRSWYEFLDRVRDEGLVNAEAIEAEKTAINDSRPVASAPISAAP